MRANGPHLPHSENWTSRGWDGATGVRCFWPTDLNLGEDFCYQIDNGSPLQIRDFHDAEQKHTGMAKVRAGEAFCSAALCFLTGLLIADRERSSQTGADKHNSGFICRTSGVNGNSRLSLASLSLSLPREQCSALRCIDSRFCSGKARNFPIMAYRVLLRERTELKQL